MVNPLYPYDGPNPFATSTWGGVQSYFERWDAKDGDWKDDGKLRDVSLRFKLVDSHTGSVTSVMKDAESVSSVGLIWKRVMFAGSVPTGTSVGIAVESASCGGFAAVTAQAAGGAVYDLPACARGRYARWKLTLRTENVATSPKIESVTLYGGAPE